MTSSIDSPKEESTIREYPIEEGGHVEKDDETSGVPVQYRGTECDKRDMSMLGKKQVLRRNFQFLTMLGFASTVMSSWELVLPWFTYILINGGTGILFWGTIVCCIGMMLIYASLSEMASMCPTAGGQYHWVSEFAPPKIQKLLSYSVGWLCAIGWQVYLTAVCYLVATMIQGLIALNVETYVWENYHGTLLTIAVLLFAIMFNTVLASRLPIVEGIALILHLVGAFIIIIPLWVMAPRATPDILMQFENNGAWSSTGLSSMIGITVPLGVLIGYDCSVHMSEEIKDASATLPKALVWSAGINFVLVLLVSITMIFTMGDVSYITSSYTIYPFILVFYQATNSLAATNAMTAVVIILLTSSSISEVATASRQIWSFARDGGLPGSKWLTHVTPGSNIPFRAVLVSLVVTALLSCINLGSSVALNAIASVGTVSVMASYFVTIGCLVWRRIWGAPLPPRRWSLGKFGLLVNILSLMFLIPLWFFAFWPLYFQPTIIEMNWSSLIFGGSIIFALVYYFVRARHVYIGPVALVKREW